MRHYPGVDLISVPLSDAVLQAADCVLLVTDHSAYDYDMDCFERRNWLWIPEMLLRMWPAAIFIRLKETS